MDHAGSKKHPSDGDGGTGTGVQKTEDGSQSAKGYLEIKKSPLSKLEG